MPSDLIIEVCKIDKIMEHPKGDRLEILHIKGWQVVIGKGICKPNMLVVYFPPDSLIPTTLSDKLGVTDYLSVRQYDGEPWGRVKTIKLRKEISYGFVAKIEDFGEYLNTIQVKEGDDLATRLGIKKWEPPTRKEPGAQRINNRQNTPGFDKYTDIQNIRNYNKVFEEGELVVVLEKIHGTNSRVGVVKNPNKRWWKPWTWGKRLMAVVGSHNVERDLDDAIYSIPVKDDKLALLIHNLSSGVQEVIIYSEIYGKKVQDMEYGLSDQQYAVFDIKVDGEYMTWDMVNIICKTHDVPTVPTLYEGKFNWELVEKLSQGKTKMPMENPHIREGCVVKSAEEERHPKLGRKILKFINDAYLLRKKGTENH